jgi:hypothetical protein
MNFEDYTHERQGELDMAPLSLKIPDVPETEKVVISRAGVPLAEVNISPHTPQVEVTYPNGGEEFVAGEAIPVQWNSSDEDGDPLSHVISYSLDGGASYMPLALDKVGETCQFQTDPGMQSDSVLIRVIVTDGVNTAMDFSDAVFAIHPSECPPGNHPCQLLELISQIHKGRTVRGALFQFSLSWY